MTRPMGGAGANVAVIVWRWYLTCMQNPLRSILDYRRKLIADRKAFEDWEDRVVEPILNSGKDQLLWEVYKHRTYAVLLSLGIGAFACAALVAYVLWGAAWVEDWRFYLILAVCVVGAAWVTREVTYHVRSCVEKMRVWTADNNAYFRRASDRHADKEHVEKSGRKNR